jgi:hypothetical protein
MLFRLVSAPLVAFAVLLGPAPLAQAGRVNYAAVRAAVGHAYAEKAYEMGEVLAVLQGLSKESAVLVGKIETHCDTALPARTGRLRAQ